MNRIYDITCIYNESLSNITACYIARVRGRYRERVAERGETERDQTGRKTSTQRGLKFN